MFIKIHRTNRGTADYTQDPNLRQKLFTNGGGRGMSNNFTGAALNITAM
jgi:hypothetical protein